MTLQKNDTEFRICGHNADNVVECRALAQLFKDHYGNSHPAAKEHYWTPSEDNSETSLIHLLCYHHSELVAHLALKKHSNRSYEITLPAITPALRSDSVEITSLLWERVDALCSRRGVTGLFFRHESSTPLCSLLPQSRFARKRELQSGITQQRRRQLLRAIVVERRVTNTLPPFSGSPEFDFSRWGWNAAA